MPIVPASPCDASEVNYYPSEDGAAGACAYMEAVVLEQQALQMCFRIAPTLVASECLIYTQQFKAMRSKTTSSLDGTRCAPLVPVVLLSREIMHFSTDWVLGRVRFDTQQPNYAFRNTTMQRCVTFR